MKTSQAEVGSINPLVISNVLVGLIAISLAGFSIWSFTNYTDQKNNVDSKVSTAVAAATKVQVDKDELLFLEREKVPTREFVGLDDFGRVSFQYPKTWSVYVAVNGVGGKYEAYLNPGIVPPVSTSQPFATRITVESKAYDAIVKTYETRVEKKELVSSPITIGSFDGIRLDGVFTKERKGSVVIFKVRDKTLTVSSDAEAFRTDFDNIILKSLSFNP
ncbi:hypothetical protein H7Y40_01150 [Pedobacter sp.]|nr:hypothetical protein [Candidatus Saccharibacteria bacterium]